MKKAEFKRNLDEIAWYPVAYLLDVKVKLKDERAVLIREFQAEDKFVEMYEGLSAEAVRWGLPPYTRERLEKGWLSNLQNLISIIAFYNDKIVGDILRSSNFLIQD